MAPKLKGITGLRVTKQRGERGLSQTKILQRMDMNKKNEKQTLQASQLSTWGCKGSIR